jgi:hypothetical protein
MCGQRRVGLLEILVACAKDNKHGPIANRPRLPHNGAEHPKHSGVEMSLDAARTSAYATVPKGTKHSVLSNCA